MNSLKPMLLTSLKSYSREQFFKDVTAGIIVAIIALPLSIALALASGVGPEAGIFTAIVAVVSLHWEGAVCRLLVRLQPLRQSWQELWQETDWMVWSLLTVLAGVFLILMGLCHFGTLVKFIPYTIT